VASVATLLEAVQPRMTLASGTLLGRASIGPGGPEPIGVGNLLAIQNGQLVMDPRGLAPLDSPAFTGTLSLGTASSQLGFFGVTGGTRPIITGSRAGNGALASLLSALAGLGVINDESTP